MESGESPHFLTLFFPFTEEENSGQNGDKSSVGPAGPPADHFSQLRHVQGDEILEQCGLCGPGSQDSLQVRMSISAELFTYMEIKSFPDFIKNISFIFPFHL